MPVNLAANNYEILRASYTAMDQTYGNVAVGNQLHPIDNANDGTTPPRSQPFKLKGSTIEIVANDRARGSRTQRSEGGFHARQQRSRIGTDGGVALGVRRGS